MPLLDHFRPPLYPRHRWLSFHSNWATRVADRIAERLPPEFVVEEHTHPAPGLEVDIATYEDAPDSAPPSANGAGVQTARVPALWSPPAPAHTVAATYPDNFEVRVFSTVGGLTLVAVVEFVSPGNKDRGTETRAFVAKCMSYLHQGVSLVVIDVVTNRRANLHNELVEQMGWPDEVRFPPDAALYTSAFRPLLRSDQAEVEVWKEPLAVGRPIPTMPLRLTGDLFVPVEFEDGYTEACRRRGIGS